MVPVKKYFYIFDLFLQFSTRKIVIDPTSNIGMSIFKCISKIYYFCGGLTLCHDL